MGKGDREMIEIALALMLGVFIGACLMAFLFVSRGY